MKEMVLAIGLEDFTVRYFRTKGESEETKTPIYGVMAAKYIDDVEKESACAGFVSEDKAYVDELIATLGKNTVTPMVLCEVLDELME